MTRSLRRAASIRVAARAVALLLLTTAPAAAQQARITNLSDVTFGTLSNLAVDTSKSQSVCAYSTGTLKRYHVTATGSGTGGAFTLASSGATLPYEVQWNQSPEQTSGTSLTAGVALTAQTSTATQQTCNSGPATTASLIVLLRAATLTAATAGVYSGTLTIILAPN